MQRRNVARPQRHRCKPATSGRETPPRRLPFQERRQGKRSRRKWHSSVNRYRLHPDQLTAYRGHSLLILDSRARLATGLDGLYFRRTRFLSRCVLEVDGREPELVSANPVEPHAITSYHLAPSPAGTDAGPPDQDSGGEIARKAIEILVNRFVGGGLHQDVHVTNHGLAEATVALSFQLDADFADQREASEDRREQNAPVSRRWTTDPQGGGELAFSYRQRLGPPGRRVSDYRPAARRSPSVRACSMPFMIAATSLCTCAGEATTPRPEGQDSLPLPLRVVWHEQTATIASRAKAMRINVPSRSSDELPPAHRRKDCSIPSCDSCR